MPLHPTQLAAIEALFDSELASTVDKLVTNRASAFTQTPVRAAVYECALWVISGSWARALSE